MDYVKHRIQKQCFPTDKFKSLRLFELNDYYIIISIIIKFHCFEGDMKHTNLAVLYKPIKILKLNSYVRMCVCVRVRARAVRLITKKNCLKTIRRLV